MPNKNIDSTPTNGSNNLVTSDGVYDAVSTKVTGTGIGNIVKLTKTEYDALVTKDPLTMYLVEDIGAAFGGFNIAPAPLYYGASGFEIKDTDWNHSSYNDKYGTTEGSYLFSYVDVGKYFDSEGSSFSGDSEIDNANTINGWRIPTKSEFEKILTSDINVRTGSSVNGNTNKHYSFVKLTGVTVSGTTDVWGIIIYPDGKTITGATLNSYDSTTITENITESDINNYISQGCMFIPGYGSYTGAPSWGNSGNLTYMITATKYSSTKFYYARIGKLNNQSVGQIFYSDLDTTSQYCTVILMRDAVKQYKLYFGSTLIADSNTINDIASILATI